MLLLRMFAELLDGLATVPPPERGLKIFGFRVRGPKVLGSCLRLSRKNPKPEPPPTPSVRMMNGDIGPRVEFT